MPSRDATPAVRDLRLIDSVTTAGSIEGARQALIDRAANPPRAPAGAEDLLRRIPPSLCSEMQSASVSPVGVYRVALEGRTVGSVGDPDCWRLPAFDQGTAQRAAAVCLSAGAVRAPDPIRTSVGSMYGPVIETLWSEISAGSAGGETIAALLAVARSGRPALEHDSGPMLDGLIGDHDA